ncbi:hypothetical protein MBLNU459_g0728t1 [Dothideomycetes sp. NU459]
MPSLITLLLTTVTLLLATTSAAPTASRGRSSTPAIPLNGLPSPSGLTLRYIALGLGTQNYTCPNTTTAPIANGALATLYDATALLRAAPAAVSTLPALAYSTGSSLSLPTLGHHWFSAAGVPTFDLEAAIPRAFLSAKKVAYVAAPADSVPNSVPWLYLVDDGRGVSVGLKAVYRVETAGGAAPATCAKVGELTVRYAAEYWFYD